MESKARRILNMNENSLHPFDPADAAASFQANIEVVSSNDLLKQIEKSLGQQAGEDFKDLVIKHAIPKDPNTLAAFFQGRRDLVSMACFKQLKEPQTNA